MKVSALRRVTLLVVSLMVSGCAVIRPQADAMDYSAVASPGSTSKIAMAPLDTDLSFARNFDVALRHAQDLRKHGQLDEASRVLAQMVLAAPDDPRVVGEYGKVMLERGYTGDAVAFLERAIVLQPSDWTLHSALGVAYDQAGKRDEARASFHHALLLNPGESTVLSNLALSHMQAGELDEAERLLLQAAEQRKDVPGIAEKLAMVRNIRTTTGQSRPMAVSTLPQPIATPAQIQAPVAPPVVPEATPAAIQTAPAPASAPELIEEEPALPGDEADVAVITAPVATAVPATVGHTDTIKISLLQFSSNVISEVTAKPVKAPAKTTSIAAPKSQANSPKVITKTNKLSAEANVESKKTPAAVRAPAKTVAVVNSQPAAKALRAPRAAAPQLAVSMHAESTPAPRASTPAVKVASIATPAAKAPEPMANPTPQAAMMTRRADVASAMTRTAPAPLVLAPARNSWESMVRVSLPPAADAGFQSTPSAEQIPTPATSSAKSSGWSDIVTGWVTAALGFIGSFWA